MEPGIINKEGSKVKLICKEILSQKKDKKRKKTSDKTKVVVLGSKITMGSPVLALLVDKSANLQKNCYRTVSSTVQFIDESDPESIEFHTEYSKYKMIAYQQKNQSNKATA